MFYRSENARDPKTIVIDDAGLVDGGTLQRDIKHLVKLIVDDDQKETPPLQSEAFVIAIQGSWGTGKTWASWAFINHLRTQQGFKDEHKLHVFPFELLPFGNINESIGNILGSIADRLWGQGVVDVRSELRQMAIDATPAQEVTAGLRLMGFTLTRKFLFNSRYKQNKEALRRKFESLSGQGHRFLIVLDDLDRMKPDEVVIVIRMVENFKDIPGIIFILPFYRDAVAGSIRESLKLDEASAHVFLRKFIKASVTIELEIENLKSSFKREFQYGESGDANGAVHNRFGMNTSDLAWYTLLHILLIRDTIAAVGSEKTGTTVNAHYNNNEASSYLFKLPKFLGKARKPQNYPEASPSPYATDGKWKRFPDVYGLLAENSDAAGVIAQLQSLMSEETLTNSIYTEAGLVNDLRQAAEIDFDEKQAKNLEQTTVFEAIMLPLLQETTNEPKLTKNYSRRDVEQLAKAICNDPGFRIEPEPTKFLKSLIAIVRKRFMEFR